MARSEDIRLLFGQAVRRIRVGQNMSQEQLAYEAELDRSYVGGVERGDRNPSLVAIQKIAQGLKTSLADLFAECDGRGAREPNVRAARR